MTVWVLTAGLQNLRSQVNAAFPNRDKASDGSIGDAAHMTRPSGHNPDGTPDSKPAWDDGDATAEVRAWDMDADLGDPDVTTQNLVNHLRRLAGVNSVLRYIIFDRTLYHVRNGFAPEPYTGSSPHIEHVHFEGAWTQAADSNTTFDFRLGDLIVPTADEIATAVVKKIRATFPVISDSDRNALAGAVDAKLAPRFAALAAKDVVDEQALGAALAEAVVAAVGGLSTAAEKARLLAPLLGDDATEVGRILAAS